MNNFLSDYECDGLIAAHEDHLNVHKKHKPIVCFSDESTMLLYLAQAKVNWAKRVSTKDFLSGKYRFEVRQQSDCLFDGDVSLLFKARCGSEYSISTSRSMQLLRVR